MPIHGCNYVYLLLTQLQIYPYHRSISIRRKTRSTIGEDIQKEPSMYLKWPRNGYLRLTLWTLTDLKSSFKIKMTQNTQNVAMQVKRASAKLTKSRSVIIFWTQTY
jgi:hypothetical protein